jgi:hypothetical protein
LGLSVLDAAINVQRAITAHMQDHVFDQLQQHYVAALLAGPEPVYGATGSLWCEAMADAACRLLRCGWCVRVCRAGL